MPDPRAYRRLAALLRDQITSGMITPGAQLPPIGDLRRQHGHSQQTVTKAMGVLHQDGLICAGGQDSATSRRTRMSKRHATSQQEGPSPR